MELYFGLKSVIRANSGGRRAPVGWPLGAGRVAAGRRSGGRWGPVGRWSGAGRAPEVSILV